MLDRHIIESIATCVPMLLVRDMRTTVEWYRAFGFSVEELVEDECEVIFARLSLGNASMTLSPGADSGPRDVRLWFVMDGVEDLYAAIRQKSDIRFEEELYDPFYGGKQFSVTDCNGVHLVFWRPAARA